MSKSLFWKLEKLGRIKLSMNYQFRQFLSSEIAMAYGVPNVPDNVDLAIEVGQQLCENVLEPLTDAFGPLIIRSGFRSARVNELGAAKGLMCAGNEKNLGYHIWDHRDAEGHSGAAACIVIPAFNAGETDVETWQDLAWWIDKRLPYNRLTFFKRDNAFNIGWHESPKRIIFSRNHEPHWLKKHAEN